MSERKSGRPRKTISYAALGGEESDSDDFACGPSSKKQKQSSKKEDKSKKSSRSSSSILKRESSYDVEFQQALELSRLEVHGSQQAAPETNDLVQEKPKEHHQHQPHSSHTRDVRVDIEPQPTIPPLDRVETLQPPVLLSDTDLSPNPPRLVPITASLHPSVAVMDTSIVSIGSDSECEKPQQNPTRLAKRSRAPKKSIMEDVDSGSEVGSDFAPGEDSDGSNDNGDETEFSPTDDDDSDFDGGRKTSKKKSETKPSKKKAVVSQKKKSTTKSERKSVAKDQLLNPPLRENATKVSVSCKDGKDSTKPKITGRKISPASAPVTKVSSSSSSSSLIVRRESAPSSHEAAVRSVARSTSSPQTLVSREWKPPGQASTSSPSLGAATSPSIRSPSSGLRLGLSRNQRVKPLHDSVRVV